MVLIGLNPMTNAMHGIDLIELGKILGVPTEQTCMHVHILLGACQQSLHTVHTQIQHLKFHLKQCTEYTLPQSSTYMMYK